MGREDIDQPIGRIDDLDDLLALGVLAHARRSQRRFAHRLFNRIGGNLDAVAHLAGDLHRQRDDAVRCLPGRLLSG